MSYMEGKMRERIRAICACLAETKSEPKQSRNARSSSLSVLVKSPATLETPKSKYYGRRGASEMPTWWTEKIGERG